MLMLLSASKKFSLLVHKKCWINNNEHDNSSILKASLIFYERMEMLIR